VASGVVAVAAGSRHTCVLTVEGGIRCWGQNGNGQLGDGTYDDARSPPAVDVIAGARGLAASLGFTCALTVTGGVRCWGYNSDGQLGDETELAVDRLAPAALDVLGNVREVKAGAAHTCVATTEGGVRCWGANASGQLGDGLAPDLAERPPTVDVPGFTGTCR
jgi:alpha-tubulin suppressor-like RCC1 family protein